MRYVSYKTLAGWIGFTPETVRLWSVDGKLDRHFEDGKLYHSEESVNAFLASVTERARYVTFEQFRQGMRLLTFRQAADVLGITPVSFQTKIHRKRLGGLHFEGEWRFADEAIFEYKMRRAGYVTRNEVMHIFGCSQTVLIRWERDGVLSPLQVRGAGDWRYYYRREDVIRTVQRCLPVGAHNLARDWLFEASVGRPPFASAEAMEYLGLLHRELVDMADKGRIFYLSLGSAGASNRRFSPVGVERALLQQPSWTPYDIGRAIHANASQVNGWLVQGTLECHIHNHYGMTPRSVCVAAMISPLLSPGIAARKWLMGAKASPNRPMATADEAAEYYNVPIESINSLAQSGFLGGLRRPDGVWVFTWSRLRRSNGAQVARQLAAQQ